MTTSTRNLYRILALAGLSLLALPAVAQGRPSGREPAPFAAVQGLTEAQRTSLAAIQESHRSSLTARHETARAAGEALRAAMAKPGQNRKEVVDLFEKESKARLAILEERLAIREEAAKILTPDQLAQWLASGHGRGGRHRGFGRG